MNKIGICACYDTRNYGSMLQAFATQKTIDNMGYESEYIVYKKKKNLKFFIKQIPRLLNKNLINDKMLGVKKNFDLRKHTDIKKQLSVRESAFKRFQNEYYKAFSPVYYGYEALRVGAKNYDSVVVGSDQLWTPGGLATNFYNLMFVPNDINKVSYATSFGVANIPFYQYGRTREYLTRIDYLSVREAKGAEIIKDVAGLTAKVVADPTMLLTKEEWNLHIPNKRIIEEPYIFCYFLGKNTNHRVIANELKSKTGLKIVSIPYLDSFVKVDMTFGDVQLFDVGPDDFVNLIRHACYILTDSFHGSVFSIIHNKKFMIFDRYEETSSNSRNSRIDSLCNSLGLSERRYFRDIFESIEQEINYIEVNNRLNQIRLESLDFLENALKKG